MLANSSSHFTAIVADAVAYWSPGPIPMEMVFSELGASLVHHAGEPGVDVRTIFAHLEAVLVEATRREREVAIAGFLSAVIAALDDVPTRRWILDYTGPVTRAYISAWRDDGFAMSA